MEQKILEVNHLIKRFGSFTAVDDISFSVKEGEIVGLLGPNGAGKTTTIHMLLDLMTPTSGAIRYFGREFPKEREYCLSHINFASAYAKLQAKMTVSQNLLIYAGLYAVTNAKKKVKDLLELLEVTPVANELFWKLSSGQKTRVIFAKALLNNPRLILMDEPTASLDPDIATKIISLVAKLKKEEGVSILYTSHNMEEVERLCDRVVFLDHGKIVAVDTVLGLTKRIKNSTVTLTFDGKEEPVSKYLTSKSFVFKFSRPHVVEITVPETEIPKVLFGLSKENVWLTDIDIEKPDLTDVFLSIVKGEYEQPKN